MPQGEFVSEEEDMLSLCELHRNTLVIPQDRAKINTYRNFADAGNAYLEEAAGQELRRIWDYVEPQT